MNLDIFKSDDKDTMLLSFIKREALCKIELYTEEVHKQYWYDYYKALCDIIKAGNDSEARSGFAFLQNIVQTYDRIINKIPLSPIDIIFDNFIKNEDTGIYYHNRTHNLIWDNTKSIKNRFAIINNNAYHLHIRKQFDFIKNEVEDTSIENNQYKIYISKGGVITGEYIENVYIKPEEYNNKNYIVKNYIIIPVASVHFYNNRREAKNIYIVDHREPELKRLIEQYDVNILIDEEIVKLKLNVRGCGTENKRRDKVEFYKTAIFDRPKMYNNKKISTIYSGTNSENETYTLMLSNTIIAKWKNNHLTIFWTNAKYKKINSEYWRKFTGYNLQELKKMNNYNNPNINFV